jgi:cell shape-determining protein MreC
MNYLLKSSNFEERKKKARNNIFIITIILIIAIIILSTGPAKRLLFFVAEPVWKIENSIKNSDFFEYFKAKGVLINEKLAIEQKLFLAGNMIALNDSLQKENDNLKDLLGRKETKKKTVLALVLVKPPQTPYDLLTIDVGEDFGVQVGNKVIANGNVYLGEVSDVLAHSAKVTLYSTPDRKLSVVLGSSSISVEAIGIGGGNFNIFLPREVEVKENDVIVIPAITSNIFGIVEKVNFKETDSFQTVLFKSPVNISELSFVEVILDK